MGLYPLEYTDCLCDSPSFRGNLNLHEKELNRTNSAIKEIIKQIRDLHSSALVYSKCHRSLASSLQNFQFEVIGTTLTDDELIISNSLKEFAKQINLIEDERDRVINLIEDERDRVINLIEDERDLVLEKTLEQFVSPLEAFRKNHINKAKDAKKRFEKQSAKFMASQEKNLSLSTKKQDFKEADAILEFEQKAFVQTSLEYVFCLQEVHERKKFEFVETLMHLVYSFLAFYHTGHEIAKDFKPYMTDLQMRVQKTRENFDATYNEAQALMRRTLEIRQTRSIDPGSLNKSCTREGYLYVMEKKAFSSTWSKQYCKYLKENRVFTMISCNFPSGKIVGTETIRVKSCTRRPSDIIEKRFCFDISADDKPGVTFTLQALTDEDCRLWMDAMDGKEPTYVEPGKISESDQTTLDQAGYSFVKSCIAELESRGLEEQGLYRVVGVGSKAQKLVKMGLDRRKSDPRENWLSDRAEYETKTITSALKMFFRNLPEPLMTYNYHAAFIMAAKNENRNYRIQDIHLLVHKLPEENCKFLETLIAHLNTIVSKSDKNLMTVSNLGVCFGPTLLRPENETMASIMEIKFSNVVVEILIENYAKIFQTQPDVLQELRINGERPPAYNPPPSYPFRHSTETIPVKDVPKLNFIGIPPPPSQTRQNVARSMPNPQITQAIVTSFCDGPSRPITVPSEEILGPDWRKGFSAAVPQQPIRNRLRPTAVCPPIAIDVTDSTTDTSSSDRSNTSSRSSSREPKISPKPVRRPVSSDAEVERCPQSVRNSVPVRRVRTLYACRGDNESELSFEPNQIITNARPSKEPGWLEGMLNGKIGLVPENYVEYLP